jgi:hypothetical protein
MTLLTEPEAGLRTVVTMDETRSIEVEAACMTLPAPAPSARTVPFACVFCATALHLRPPR